MVTPQTLDRPARIHVYVDAANFFLTFGSECDREAWLREINWAALCEMFSERLGGVVSKLVYGVGLPSPSDPAATADVPYRSGQQLDAIRRAGGMVLEGFLARKDAEGGGHTEKCVDTALVAQMVRDAYADECDVVVLLSGDADFIPAVQLVCEAGKRIIVATWDGKSTSERLKIVVNDLELAQMFNIWGVLDQFVPYVHVGKEQRLQVDQFRMWQALLDAERLKGERGTQDVLLEYMRFEATIPGIDVDQEGGATARYTLLLALLNSGLIENYGVGAENATALRIVRRSGDRSRDT